MTFHCVRKIVFNVLKIKLILQCTKEYLHKPDTYLKYKTINTFIIIIS